MNFISENKAKLLHFYRYNETYNTCNALIAVFVLRARAATRPASQKRRYSA